MSKGWKYYWPDEGYTADDAITLKGEYVTLFEAARAACEADFYEHDGWERNGRDFQMTIIDPTDHSETVWDCSHEPTVEHMVFPAADN